MIGLSKASFMLTSALLVLLASCAQTRNTIYSKLSSINLIDREGLSETFTNTDRLKKYEDVDFLSPQPYQKVLRVLNRTKNGEVKAYVTSYHANGQIKQYLEIVNGRAYGTYKEWHPNGTLKVEAFVIGGSADITMAAEKSWLFDGCSRAWDEEGNLIAEIPYSKGDLQGESLYFYPCGSLWRCIPFDKNEVNGTFQMYQKDGQLVQTAEYKHGVREGPSVRYWEDGSIAAQELFCKDILTTGDYFNFSGKPLAEVREGNGYRALFTKDGIAELQRYKEGSLEGEIKVFKPDGSLNKIYHVKNGIRHGEEIEYYYFPKQSDLRPKLSLIWSEAKIQGLVKTWYENGMQESQREMTNNMKNGLATAWYQDGSLMLIEEYDQDKLMRGKYYKREEKTPVSEVTEGKGIATLFDANGHFLRKVNYSNGKPND